MEVQGVDDARSWATAAHDEPQGLSGPNRSNTLRLTASFIGDTQLRTDTVRLTKNQALFNLISSVVGAGIMALPKTVSRVGWLPGIGLLCLVTMVSTAACQLCHSAMSMNPGAECAEDLALQAFGPSMRKFVLVFNNGDLFATCVILLVGGGDALSVALGTDAQTWCILGVGIAVALLSLPKDLSGLSKAALVGVVTLFGYVCLYLTDCLFRLGGQKSDDQTLANWDLSKIAGAASIVGFSYSCAILVPSMHSEMEVEEDLPWVINVGHGIVFCIYASMAFIGYAAYGNEGLDVKNQPEIKSLNEIPYSAEICSFLILVTIGVGYPLFMNPMVVYIQNLIQEPDADAGRELTIRLTVRLLMAAATLIAALTIPYFYEIVLLTGAVSANLMCVILPVAYYLKSVSNEQKKGIHDNAPTTIVWVAIAVALIQGLIVMVVGVYYGVIDLANAIREGNSLLI